jgi:hypothetical protein
MSPKIHVLAVAPLAPIEEPMLRLIYGDNEFQVSYSMLRLLIHAVIVEGNATQNYSREMQNVSAALQHIERDMAWDTTSDANREAALDYNSRFRPQYDMRAPFVVPHPQVGSYAPGHTPLPLNQSRNVSPSDPKLKPPPEVLAAARRMRDRY